MDNTRLNVLVIANDREALQEFLANISFPQFDLVCADRLATGLSRLAQSDIDVALLALSLPDSQGLATFETFHAHAPDVPVVVLTDFDDEATAVQAVQAGAEDYLGTGQIDSFMLPRILGHAVERQRLRKEMRQQLKALQASEARFGEMINKNADGMIVVDAQGIVRFVNSAAEALFHRPAAEFLGTVFDFPVLTGETREVEITANGNRITAEMRVVDTTWEGRRAFLASLRDMSDRKQTEEALREAKEYAENLINSSSDIIVSVDIHHRIIEFNTAAERAFGYAKSEVLGQTVDLLYANPNEGADIQARLGQHGSFAGEVVNRRQDGSTFVAYLSASVLHDSNGRVTGMMGISRDVTAAKEAEQKLQKAHQDTARLLAAIPSILIGLDAHRRIIWWNSTAERTFGIPAAAVAGRSIEACDMPWEPSVISAALAHCHQTGQPVGLDDVAFRCADGREGVLGLTVNHMHSTAEDELCFLLFGADITERKIMQAQLAQAQKLESIGQLAAGIAHEINTPTQYVSDNTRFLHEAFGDLDTLLAHYTALLQAAKAGPVPTPLIQEIEATAEAIDVDYLREEIPTAIQQSLEGVERVATIVRAMKEFSHPGSEEKTAIDLNRAIESTITVARNEWKYVADLVTDFDPALPLVACLPAEFNQAVLNIIVNAAHALADKAGDGPQDKGTITVRTRHEGDWVEVRIADTGPGIPKAIRDKIFDPFFTTKEVGKGTGQGLAIAHDVVVKKHGGTLTFETAEGQGTTFCIRLPLESLPVAAGDAV